MLPKIHRLSSRDIALFWKRRDVVRLAGPFLAVYCAQNRVGYNRGTVVVGSAVDRRAAQRNAIKRRIRAELFQYIQQSSAAKNVKEVRGYDIIVVASPKLRGTGRETLNLALAEKLKKIFL